ncbi:MAG TPA: DUF502 domain-containing protein [Gammaproteobacteria bacterium]|jgi:uncharacterized membrane protein|nr:DUF502 domain-containing protein [Gammaproteobacteria bacterium]
MKKLSSLFLQGLAAILPIAVTIYLLYWTGSSAEALLGGLLQRILPADLYVPGMGLAAGVLLTLLLGLLLNAYLVQAVWHWLEGLMARIPLVKTIFSATQDMMRLLSPAAQKELSQVVMVPLGDSGYRILGFVTRQDTSDLPPGLGDADTIAVYTPLSYQIGGYTLLVPRSSVTPIDMSVEQAMRFALTAGVSSGAGRGATEENQPATTASEPL